MDIERKLYRVSRIGNLAGGTNGTHEAPFVALLIRVSSQRPDATGETNGGDVYSGAFTR